MADYLPRLADSILAEALRSSGAVLVKGPKWCGKTATSERQSNSAVFLQNPDQGESLIELANTKPSLLLRGAEPRLIDEWQEAPKLWDAVRFALDRNYAPGRFILTGSATRAKNPSTRESAASPDSLWERCPCSSHKNQRGQSPYELFLKAPRTSAP